MSFVDMLQDFQTLGCDDQVKCALGVRIFLDLECDKRVTNLKKCYDADLNLVYLQGCRDSATVTFLPVLSTQPINFIDVENFQKKLIGADTKNSGIIMTICDTSSNILYYQVTSGVIDKK